MDSFRHIKCKASLQKGPDVAKKYLRFLVNKKHLLEKKISVLAQIFTKLWPI